MSNLNGHDFLVFLSSIACIAGLILLSDSKQNSVDELEQTEEILLRMSFTYWLVYCVAVVVVAGTLLDSCCVIVTLP